MQQTTVVTGVGVQPQPYVVGTASTRPFNDRQAKVVGIVLIILGCLGILFNTIELTIGTGIPGYYGSGYGSYIDNTLSHSSLGVAGHGIWCGILFIVAGVFGLEAARDKTICKMTAFMILTIIGSVFAGVQILIAAIGASGMDLKYHEERYKCDDKTGNYKEYSVVCREVRTVFAMEILLAVLGVVAFGACLWGSILCCVNKGCCASNPIVAFAMVPAGQPQMTVVTEQQQQQQSPGGPVAYPRY